MIRPLSLFALVVSLAACSHNKPQVVNAQSGAVDAQKCQTLGSTMAALWPDASTSITQTYWHAESESYIPKDRPIPVNLPPHCEVYGQMQAHKGVDGQDYAINFHIRLPQTWNGRFLFQGGGGSNGNIGDATGSVTIGKPTAIEQGFAVVTQDSGHDNSINTVADKNGELAFGLDPIARANYGGTSLKPVADATKQVIQQFYGKQPDYSYFNGCSKGGQEGMMFAQRYSDVFDGIVAKAPGFALPRAALSEVWDSQAFGTTESGAIKVTLDSLRKSFSDKQLKTVQTSVLNVCDAADGLKDGMTMNFSACGEEQVIAELNKHLCGQSETAVDACLTPTQVNNLNKVMQGPKDSQGNNLYAQWAWDAGVGSQNWRIWKMGLEDGSVPSLNFILGAKALAGVFTTPPTVIGGALEDNSAFIENFDFNQDAAKIYAVAAPYANSAWQDIGARDADLSAFKAHGAKMIVPHGVADPVFSVLDTIDWYNEVNRQNQGKASEFVRVFPVPGMGHCESGPTVESFDALSALMLWVEEGTAPEKILAVASESSPWPGRERPLCPYPQYAKYNGKGDPEKAQNFACAMP